MAYYLVYFRCYETYVNFAATPWFLQEYPFRRIRVLGNRCLAMDYSGFQASCHSIYPTRSHGKTWQFFN
jgi:hypothetical protein